MITIVYTEFFDVFLHQFDEQKQELIKKIIEDYCDHKILLPRPKFSSIKKDIQKVVLYDANVVIFYIVLDDSWLILTGVTMPDRVA